MQVALQIRLKTRLGESGLRIRLFGRIELYWGLKPLPSPPSLAARSLLAYLCLHQNQFVLRDVLLGTLFSQQIPGSPINLDESQQDVLLLYRPVA